jgi:hypothetical protein
MAADGLMRPLVIVIMVAAGACKTSEAPRAAFVPPDGVVCGATACQGSAACCTRSESCFAVGTTDSGCTTEYLECDGPEDCPGSWCCYFPEPIAGASPPFSACAGQWDDARTVSCPSNAIPMCKNNAECQYVGLPICAVSDGGYGSTPGAIMACAPN